MGNNNICSDVSYSMNWDKKFSVVLEGEEYKGTIGAMSDNGYFRWTLFCLEMFGKKAYDSLVRQDIRVDDNEEKLWAFIEKKYGDKEEQ